MAKPKTKPLGNLVKATAMARLVRLERQNEILLLELRRTQDQFVPVADFRRAVIRANVTVKTRLLALPNTLAPQVVGVTIPEAAELMRRSLTETLNDLAYEGEQEEVTPEPLPTETADEDPE